MPQGYGMPPISKTYAGLEIRTTFRLSAGEKGESMGSLGASGTKPPGYDLIFPHPEFPHLTSDQRSRGVEFW
jgi:hypothetical protein